MSQWCRLWEDMPNDPKFRVVAKRAGRPVSEVLAVFVHMMTNAANASERGHLDGWHDDAVAIAIDAEPEHVAAIMAAMQGRVLDGDRLTGWEKRQPRREDGSAERAKAWREARKAETKSTVPLLDVIERDRTLEAEAEQSRTEAGRPASAPAREPAASPPDIEDRDFEADCTAALGGGRIKGSFAPMLAVIGDRGRIVALLGAEAKTRPKPIGSWGLAATVAAEALASGQGPPGQGARASPNSAAAMVFVEVDTPPWRAWMARREAEGKRGCPVADDPSSRSRKGWRFPTLWPPGVEPEINPERTLEPAQ